MDAAVFSADNKYGMGMCIRGHTGEFYKGKTMWFYGIPTPQEAESMGFRQALLWLVELELTSVSIELDCLLVVNGVKDSLQTNFEFGAIVSHCRCLLSCYQSFQVRYVRRKANLAAHTLVRVSRFHASSKIFDFIPTCIGTIILNETR